MTTAVLPMLEELPRQNATQVKNKWGDVARQVFREGGVAITSHSKVEMVILPADRYRQLVEQLMKREQEAKLLELELRFDARLMALQHPDARQRLNAMLEARGKLTNSPPPIAGDSY